jgi:transposase-like protein
MTTTPSHTRRRTKSSPWLDTLGGGLDLRRTGDAAAADRVVDRADWLDGPDRALVLAVLRDGLSVADLARIQDACPRALRRRLGAAVARLSDPRAVFVARNLAAIGAASPTRARVARAYYLHGRPMRAIARTHNLSLHTVRAHRTAIEGMFAGATAANEHTPRPDRAWR